MKRILLVALPAALLLFVGVAAYLTRKEEDPQTKLRSQKVATTQVEQSRVAANPVSPPPTGESHATQPIDPQHTVPKPQREDLRVTFRQAVTWRARNDALERIPDEELELHGDLLLEVASGTDVDAVRAMAIRKLGDMGIVTKSGPWVAQVLTPQLLVEPTPSIRRSLLAALGTLNVGPTDKELLFDAFSRTLSQDKDAGVREQVPGNFLRFKVERSLPVLEAALIREEDATVRAAIERAIRQVKD